MPFTASHPAAVLFGVPAWFVWHTLLAAPALRAAPRPVRARLTGVLLGVRARLRNLQTAVLTVVALAVGTATHVFWDQFHARTTGGPERRTPAFPDLADPDRVAPWWPWVLVAVAGGVGAPVAVTAEGFGGAGFDGTTWGGSAALAVAMVLAAAWHVRRRPVRQAAGA
jgi:hypothetical protein